MFWFWFFFLNKITRKRTDAFKLCRMVAYSLIYFPANFKHLYQVLTKIFWKAKCPYEKKCFFADWSLMHWNCGCHFFQLFFQNFRIPFSILFIYLTSCKGYMRTDQSPRNIWIKKFKLQCELKFILIFPNNKNNLKIEINVSKRHWDMVWFKKFSVFSSPWVFNRIAASKREGGEEKKTLT